MSENNMAMFRKEGQPAFPQADTEKETPASSPEEKNQTENTQSPDGDNNQADKEVPFDQHPRWAEREKEWNDRFNQQESRHQEDLKKLREEFGTARKENAEETEIPSWFGGTKEQWDSYRKHEDQRLKQAEENAIKRLTEAKEKEDAATREATEYMQAEIKAIESDKTLNPAGDKVDPNKLLKFVLDNDLVDSKGRWNYRAAYRLMKGSQTAAPAGDRKNLAGATTSESKAETPVQPYKTSSDFRKPGGRPW